jgi:hypothetical protein
MFMLNRYNFRTDEYGGSLETDLENRLRLFREIVEMLAELSDLWEVNVAEQEIEAGTSFDINSLPAYF